VFNETHSTNYVIFENDGNNKSLKTNLFKHKYKTVFFSEVWFGLVNGKKEMKQIHY